MPVTVMPAALARRLREADLTYPEVGATAGLLPPGYHQLRRTVTIGAGPQTFTDAAATLTDWRMHERAGLRVSATAATAEPGCVVLLSLGLGAIRISAPCRVVYVIDEPDRRGFAYGTLPGHPVRGEEVFIVTKHPDATVTFTLTAFSRPAAPLAKAAGPFGRAIQHRINRRYLRAILR